MCVFGQSDIFQAPIPAELVPDYYDHVFHPFDLSIMERRAKADTYRCVRVHALSRTCVRAGVRHNLCTMPNSWCTMRTLSTAAGTRSPATRAQFGIFVVARSIRLNCAPTYRVPIDGLHRFACVLYLTTHRRAVCFRRHGRTCWCMRS